MIKNSSELNIVRILLNMLEVTKKNYQKLSFKVLNGDHQLNEIHFSADTQKPQSLNALYFGLHSTKCYEMLTQVCQGEYFRIYILLGDLCFHISINGNPYCTFMYRLPIEEIRTIYIDKDIQTIRQIDHRTSFPSPYPMIQCEPEPGIMFSNDVPQRFRPGHVIIITAIPNGNRKGRFTIVFLQNGTRKECFHYNPRFEPHFMIVRNSMNDNLQFEREEKDGPFPFCIEQQFKLAFGLTKTKFKFAVDGHYLGSFNYRQKNLLDVLNGFKIHGCSGLTVDVTTVDHLNIGNSKCKNFEIYSDPNNHVL